MESICKRAVVLEGADVAGAAGGVTAGAPARVLHVRRPGGGLRRGGAGAGGARRHGRLPGRRARLPGRPAGARRLRAGRFANLSPHSAVASRTKHHRDPRSPPDDLFAFRYYAAAL